VLELISDLGGGKTTFVQGLARGLGYHGPVTSPTFTLSQVYRINPQLELHHYDLYRLGQSGVVGDELAEDLGDQAVITVIEWSGLVKTELPADRLSVEFEVTSVDGRRLRFSPGGPRSRQLLEALQL
jgi:tRNA threonylcarbamoyladenosine biosynthesis protein TsaE